MPRKQHSYHFIYKTTCRINEKFYIGMHSTSNLEDGYIGSGKHLWNSIKKYGKENFNFEILEWYSDRKALKKREEELVNEELLQNPLCMNLAKGGEGGYRNYEAAASGGRSIRDRSKWLSNSFGNQSHDEIMRRSQKIIETNFSLYGSANGWKGRKHSTISKEKIGIANSISQLGERNSQYGKRWMHNEHCSLRFSKEEVNEKIKEGWKLGRK